MGLAHAENITVQAEAYDVALDVSFPKGLCDIHNHAYVESKKLWWQFGITVRVSFWDFQNIQFHPFFLFENLLLNIIAGPNLKLAVSSSFFFHL